MDNYKIAGHEQGEAVSEFLERNMVTIGNLLGFIKICHARHIAFLKVN